MVTAQIYIESFIRILARQFNIEEKEFWKLKKKFLEDTLKISLDDLKPISIFQNLKNSLHNKGLHYNENYSDLEFEIKGQIFNFSHNEIVKISWDHIKELLIAISDLLFKIIDNSKVSGLKSFNEENVVILTDD